MCVVEQPLSSLPPPCLLACAITRALSCRLQARTVALAVSHGLWSAPVGASSSAAPAAILEDVVQVALSGGSVHARRGGAAATAATAAAAESCAAGGSGDKGGEGGPGDGGGGDGGRRASMGGSVLWLSLPFVAALLPRASPDARQQAAMSVNIALKVCVCLGVYSCVWRFVCCNVYVCVYFLFLDCCRFMSAAFLAFDAGVLFVRGSPERWKCKRFVFFELLLLVLFSALLYSVVLSLSGSAHAVFLFCFFVALVFYNHFPPCRCEDGVGLFAPVLKEERLFEPTLSFGGQKNGAIGTFGNLWRPQRQHSVLPRCLI